MDLRRVLGMALPLVALLAATVLGAAAAVDPFEQKVGGGVYEV